MIADLFLESNLSGHPHMRDLPQLRCVWHPDTSSLVDPKWGTTDLAQMLANAEGHWSGAVNMVAGMSRCTRAHESGWTAKQYAEAMYRGLPLPIDREITFPGWVVAKQLAEKGRIPKLVWIDCEDEPESIEGLWEAWKARVSTGSENDLAFTKAWDKSTYLTGVELVKWAGWPAECVCVEGSSSIDLGWESKELDRKGIGSACLRSHLWCTTEDLATTKRLIRYLHRTPKPTRPTVTLRPDQTAKTLGQRLALIAASPLAVDVIMYVEDHMIDEATHAALTPEQRKAVYAPDVFENMLDRQAENLREWGVN